MANGWGGARTPANPAAVSGPGRLAARTDGANGGVMNPNSPSYGEGAALESMRSAAPMAGQPGALAGAAQLPQAPVDPFAGATPFGAPTQAPGMPVTAGAAAGPGPGPSAIGVSPQTPQQAARADVAALGPGAVQAMISAASRPDATPSFRKYVRSVIYA